MNKTEVLVEALKKIVNVRGIENTPAGKIASDALTDWGKSAPASPGRPPMQRAEFEKLVWRLWKEDGSPTLQLHSYLQGAIVMDRHYRNMAPASPVVKSGEAPEDIKEWAAHNADCIANCTYDLYNAAYQGAIEMYTMLADAAPASPVEEIGQKLKLMREKKGLTPKDVLDKTGISLVYLDRLENGELKSHSASVLYKLSELYKIDLKPLLVEAGVIIKKPDESKPSPVIEIGEQLKPEDLPQTENPLASYWFEKARLCLVDRNDFKAQLARANEKIVELAKASHHNKNQENA